LRITVVLLGMLFLGLLLSAGLAWISAILFPPARIWVFALAEAVCLLETLRLMWRAVIIDEWE
jgi:hypothetical protein